MYNTKYYNSASCVPQIKCKCMNYVMKFYLNLALNAWCLFCMAHLVNILIE